MGAAVILRRHGIIAVIAIGTHRPCRIHSANMQRRFRARGTRLSPVADGFTIEEARLTSAHIFIIPSPCIPNHRRKYIVSDIMARNATGFPAGDTSPFPAGAVHNNQTPDSLISADDSLNRDSKLS